MPPIDMLAKMHLKEESAEDKLAELESLFDLRYNADMRAIKRWQKATGRDLTWPDHADLVVWLLEQLDEVEARINLASIEIPAHQKPKNCNRQWCIWPHCRDHAEVCAFTVNRRAIDG